MQPGGRDLCDQVSSSAGRTCNRERSVDRCESIGEPAARHSSEGNEHAATEDRDRRDCLVRIAGWRRDMRHRHVEGKGQRKAVGGIVLLLVPHDRDDLQPVAGPGESGEVFAERFY